MLLYRSVSAALVRAAAYPDTWEPPPRPEISGHADVDAARLRTWIERVWAQPEIADAVEVASPSLAHRVRAICAGHLQTPKQVCQAGNSLARYVLRQRHRATPFGLFAGVAPARIGTAVDMKWGTAHRAVARADAVWLAGVIAGLEAHSGLLRRLSVVADSTCFARGDRLVVPCQPPHDDQRAPGELTVRYSPAVRAVTSAATSPVAVDDLADLLAARFPDTPTGTIDGLLAELVASRVLLTCLRPPMTATDALGHVIGQLDAVSADEISAVAPTVRSLRVVHAMLAQYPDADPGTRRDLRKRIVGRMGSLSGAVDQPVVVDLRLDASLTLPRQVAREAEIAADVLARLAPFPSGSPAWRDYHARFVERYGTNALVPVLQLADPDTGLGLPAGYRGSLPPAQPTLTARDQRLLTLAQHAAVDGVHEVVLSDELVTELGQGVRTGQVPHIDLCFQLQALTHEAIERGGFTLHVVGLAPTAGATAGRFLALLDQADRDRMAELYTSLPSLDNEALRAQLSSPPLQVRTENVARVPQLWPNVISVAEHRSDSSLPLNDLAVGADETRLHLVSLTTRRRVEPVALNAVDLVHYSHPLARLLCELPRAHVSSIGPFHWGAAANLPFLPRVRYRRCVLSPATWRVTAADLAGTAATLERWHDTLTAWRTRFGVPDAVQVGDGDQRLHLLLHHSADAQLLRAHLDQVGHATLREAPEPSDYGWCDGRAHEITLALAASRTEPQPSPPVGTAFPVVVGRDHGTLPGQPGTALVKLYGHPDRQPEILNQLALVLDSPERSSRWWFVRRHGRQPHLRVWIKLAGPDAFAELAGRLGDWAATMRRLGLLGRVQWDTAYAQAGHHGTGAAAVAAVAVFAADSAAAVAQLAFAAGAGTPLPAVTAASLFDLAISLLGDPHTAAQWLTDQPTPVATVYPDRATYQAALRLGHPDHGPAVLRDLPGGDRLLAAWARRRDLVRGYHRHLTADGQPAPQTVLRSLLQLHHERVHGPDDEHTGVRLARSTALAWTARSTEATT